MSSLLSRLLPRLALSSSAPAAAVGRASPIVAASPSRMPAQSDFLFDQGIDNARLLTLFRQAFMDVQSVEGGRLRVLSENGIKLLVHADAERQALFWSAYFGLKAGCARVDKLAFANRANDRLMLARFSIADDTTLCVDYQLPVAGGVPAAMVIQLTRRLPRVIAQAMADLDEDQVLG